MNKFNLLERARLMRYPLAIAIGSLLMPSCAASLADTEPLVTNADCIPSVSLTGSEANQLPGNQMRQDINHDPLFRAATVNIAMADGYGSGALVRVESGNLAVRTARHVLEPAVSSPYGDIFFPGYGWWSVAGCELEALSSDKVGESSYSGDSVSEVRIPEDVAIVLEQRIAQGEIQPMAEFNDASADYFITHGYDARIADALTGEYTDLTFQADELTDNENLLVLDPATSGEVLCQGRSGQPVQMGVESDNSISDETFGVVSFITDVTEIHDSKYCSSTVGVIKNR